MGGGLADEIYREDVVFKDPRNTVKGKKAYRRLFKAIRVIGRICFSPIYIRVRPLCKVETDDGDDDAVHAANTGSNALVSIKHL